MALSRRREVIQRVANLPVWRSAARVRILRRAGIVIADDVHVSSEIFVSHDGPLTIDRGSSLNHHVYIDTAAAVTIGKGVAIGNHVRIVTATHDVGPADERAGAFVTAPVTIGDGCWIGASTTILPGVTIAPGCVVGAGALVARDTEPDGVYVGVPARRVRDLDVRTETVPGPADGGRAP